MPNAIDFAPGWTFNVNRIRERATHHLVRAALAGAGRRGFVEGGRSSRRGPRICRTALFRVSRYRGEKRRSGFIDAEIRPHRLDELRCVGARARPREQRPDAAQEEAAAGAGRTGGIHEITLRVAGVRGTGEPGEGRPGDAPAAESLRVRELIARLVARPVAAGARMVA